LESIASREGKSERSIRMTLSLAFLAPEIVKAAVEGRLPRGFGLKRLVDLPMAWPDCQEELAQHVGRSRAVGNPKFGVGDSFPCSPAKARRPGRIDPADH
jgi:hypothetical protein